MIGHIHETLWHRMPKDLSNRGTFDKLESILPLATMAYYRPTSTQFPAIDALLVLGDGVYYGVQYTINAKHGVNMRGLAKTVEAAKRRPLSRWCSFVCV